MRTPKGSHFLMFGALVLMFTFGLGNDSPPALIDHAQKSEAALLEFEKQVIAHPELMNFNGAHILVTAKKNVEPLKKEIEIEAIRIASLSDAQYKVESKTLIAASLRYINLVARTYYLYSKAAHYPKNTPAKMNYSKLNDPMNVELDIKLPRRVGLGLITVGTYLTPRHDSKDPYYWWFSLPQTDRMLSEMFALSRNEDGDMALTQDFESEDQAQSDLIKRYRESTFRIGTKQEYARLLQFIALRESLFNRWVINRLKSTPIPETPLNSCSKGEYLSFKTRSDSAPDLSTQLPAYTGWAEQEERINYLRYAATGIAEKIQSLTLTTPDEHFKVFLATMRAQPGFDQTKEIIKMSLDATDATLDSIIKSKLIDESGFKEGEVIANYVGQYWRDEGEKIVNMSNHPSDDFNSKLMADRVATFAYEAFREAAAGQIAIDLTTLGWVKDTSSYSEIVDTAAKIYDAKYKAAFLVKASAIAQAQFEETKLPKVKSTIKAQIFKDKLASLMETAGPVLPWVKEYRDLRVHALSNGYVKEYDSLNNPIPSPYEHYMLKATSKVPHTGIVNSYPAVLLTLESRLNLEPNQSVLELLSLDPAFETLHELWIEDSAEAYRSLMREFVLKQSALEYRGVISKAFKIATDKMRERAKPTYVMKMGEWAEENLSPTIVSQEQTKAIIDWLKKPQLPAPKNQKKPVNPRDKMSNDEKFKDSFSRFKGSVKRDQVITGPVPGPKLTEKVEKLISALGLNREFPESDQEFLTTDYERMHYAMNVISEAIGKNPMLGIAIYDGRITQVMDEQNRYMGDGPNGGIQGREGTIIKTRSGRSRSAIEKSAPTPQNSTLIEVMGDDGANPELLVQKAIDTAATQGAGLFETFCNADSSKWDSDPNFKKIFMSTINVRRAMMSMDPKLAELDESMQTELRTPLEKLQGILEWTMNIMFCVMLIALIVSSELNPLSAFVTTFIRSYVPTIFMTMGSAAMLWGFNGALLANIYARTMVNFYEKPMEVKFAQAVATQNLGDADKTMISWADAAKQKDQLKSDQHSAMTSNAIDLVFAGMFVGQLKMNYGYEAEQAAKKLGLKPLTVAEREAESMTTREHAKLIQDAENAGKGKPSRWKRFSQELDRRAQRFSRRFPKYQKFSFSEITKAYRDSLKNSMRGKNLDLFKPELDASVEFLNKRLASSKLKFEELAERPDLNTFWLLPRSFARVFRGRVVDKVLLDQEVTKLNRLGQTWYELEQDVNVLRREYIAGKLKLAASIEDKRVAAMMMEEEAGPYWIDTLSDEELALLPDLAQGPGFWWNRWATYDAGPLNQAVTKNFENYKLVLQGFSPVQYKPIKSWWGDNVDELRYRGTEGQKLYELEKSIRKQDRAPDPIRDLDYMQIKSIEATYGDLVTRGIISRDTGQIIKPLSELTDGDKRLLTRYLRGENFKLAMTEAKLDFKNPEQVSEFQDVIEYYQQMQAVDGLKVLEDRQYQELQRRLDKKLGVLDQSLEEMVKEHNLR